ncbi:MAG: hypothetical protein IPK69_11730 [Phycisphaerales bacterium]|nr:MAG: hypothetical protein IPK69_11730 [Phycisphaerales bacterium]
MGNLTRDEDGLTVLLELARSAPPMPDDYMAFIEPPEDRSIDSIVERHATWAVEWACHVFAAAEAKLSQRPLPSLTTGEGGAA